MGALQKSIIQVLDKSSSDVHQHEVIMGKDVSSSQAGLKKKRQGNGERGNPTIPDWQSPTRSFTKPTLFTRSQSWKGREI